MGKTSQIVWERLEKNSNIFGTSSKNFRDIEKPKDSQEHSGALDRLSRLDISEKPVQVNIQGGELHRVKKNKMGRCNPRQKAGVNYMGGEADSPTDPEEGRADKCKINV